MPRKNSSAAAHGVKSPTPADRFCRKVDNAKALFNAAGQFRCIADYPAGSRMKETESREAVSQAIGGSRIKWSHRRAN